MHPVATSSTTTIELPAWLYKYAHHARPILVWWLFLRTPRRPRGLRAQRAWVATQLGVTPQGAAGILRRGTALRLWKIHPRRGICALASEERMWKTVRRECCLQRWVTLTLYRPALQAPLQAQRALVGLGALSRGIDRPSSRAFSARLLECSIRTLTRYRAYACGAGYLELIPQYRKIRLARGSYLEERPRLRRGEFIKNGWVWRRLPDLAILMGPNGEHVPLATVLPRADRKRVKRRYFLSQEEADSCPPERIAQDAVFYDGAEQWFPVRMSHAMMRERASEAEEATKESTIQYSLPDGSMSYDLESAATQQVQLTSKSRNLPSSEPLSLIPSASPSSQKLFRLLDGEAFRPGYYRAILGLAATAQAGRPEGSEP